MTAEAIGTNLGDDLTVDTVVTTRVNKNHPIDNIIGDPNTGVRTRNSVTASTSLYATIRETDILHTCLYSCFISQVEPKNVKMAFK